MAMRDFLLPEFDQEMASTRKTLERIPDDKLSWCPHEKSYTMQALASHLANIPGWMGMIINQESLDVAPEGESSFKTPQGESAKHLLEMFDKNVTEARKVLAATSDETFQLPWTLLAGGNKIFTMPRGAVLRLFILSHNIHHRAQLGVYFRLNDISVPAIYGPSADEEGM
jgi:uncharacterized damage-inducible protein DinB